MVVSIHLAIARILWWLHHACLVVVVYNFSHAL